jgi:hypothetical protein
MASDPERRPAMTTFLTVAAICFATWMVLDIVLDALFCEDDDLDTYDDLETV